MEKLDCQNLPSPSGLSTSKCRKSNGRRNVWLAFVAVLLLYTSRGYWSSCLHFEGLMRSLSSSKDERCPQFSSVSPAKNFALWEEMQETIAKAEFKDQAIKWISEAVQVRTESYDDMPSVDEAPERWEHFGPFHDYLLKAFPLVHTTLSLQKVNTYGLLYTWKGSDKSLKPALFMAHQDVVPVEPTTIDDWQHPPFSGYFDGERVWGRGSSDDKSGLIGIMSTIETLIGKGFSPSRTFVLAFGFDEEASGFQGAAKLADAVLDNWGGDSFAYIIDEGGGFQDTFGTAFATPGVAEKGYLDVRLEVATPGGHSSVPPKHTSIGILSHLLVHIENHPYTVHLSRDDIVYSMHQCYAEQAPDIPLAFKTLIQQSVHSDAALLALEQIIYKDRQLESIVGTTQAADLINGGVKTNALPEQAWTVVNHRISTQSDVREHDANMVKSLAQRFNLTYEAFGENIISSSVSSGSLVLSDAFKNGLEPAPRTPIDKNAAPYALLSGTIKSTFNAYRGLSLDAEGIAVSPGMSSGNTDTRYFWSVSPHIFRYNHKNSRGGRRLSNAHTVNESLEIDAFLEMILFFSTLILNTDEASL